MEKPLLKFMTWGVFPLFVETSIFHLQHPPTVFNATNVVKNHLLTPPHGTYDTYEQGDHQTWTNHHILPDPRDKYPKNQRENVGNCWESTLTVFPKILPHDTTII